MLFVPITTDVLQSFGNFLKNLRKEGFLRAIKISRNFESQSEKRKRESREVTKSHSMNNKKFSTNKYDKLTKKNTPFMFQIDDIQYIMSSKDNLSIIKPDGSKQDISINQIGQIENE